MFVVRGQCSQCSFSRNLNMFELVMQVVPCDYAGQGCQGTMIRAWAGPKSSMPLELILAHKNRPDADIDSLDVPWYDGEEETAPEQVAIVSTRPPPPPMAACWKRGDHRFGGFFRWSDYRDFDTAIEEMSKSKENRGDHSVVIMVRGSACWPESEKKHFESVDAGILALNDLVEQETAPEEQSKWQKRRSLVSKRFSCDQRMVEGETRELRLLLPIGLKKTMSLTLDGRDFVEHVIELCEELNELHHCIPHDNFVLHYTNGGVGHLVGSWKALNAIPRNTLVNLKDAADVVSSCLSDEILGEVSPEGLSQILRFIDEEPLFGDELIAANAVQRLLDVSTRASEEASELILLIIFELLQYESGLEWLARTWDTVAIPMFKQILGQLFPEKQDEQRRQDSNIALALCLHIHRAANLVNPPWIVLAKKTSVVETLFEVAQMNDNELLTRMMSSVGEDPEAFTTKASWLIFGILLRSPSCATVETCVKGICKADEDFTKEVFKAFFEKMKVGASASENSYEEILVGRLAECSARMNGTIQASEIDVAKAEIIRLQNKLFESSAMKEHLQAQSRNRQKVLEKLVPFVVADSPAVTEGMRDVMKGGWSTAEWSQGYSLLHYVCEYSKNPNVVDLVAALCTETISAESGLNDKDIDGYRAGDYAMKNSEERIIEIAKGWQKEEDLPYACPEGEPSGALADAKASQFCNIDAQCGSPKAACSTPTSPKLFDADLEARQISDADLFRNEELFLKYWSSIKAGQSKVVIAEMQRSTTTGGLGWSEERAKVATQRLELIFKDTQEIVQDSLQRTPSQLQRTQSQTMPFLSKGAAKGKAKGAAKGALPSAETSATEEVSDSKPDECTQGGEKGKGKGKGKGKAGPPALPKAKAKAKAVAVLPTKPEVTPIRPMKSCFLEGRYLLGAAPLTVEGQDVDCIWKVVMEKHKSVADQSVVENKSLEEDLVLRYSKVEQQSTMKEVAEALVSRKKVKQLEVVEGDARLPMEMGVHKFKAAGLGSIELQKAIKENDDIDEMMLKDLIFISKELESKCPLIEAKRAAEPDIPLADLESYMMMLQPITALEQRLQCKLFLMELPENLEFCQKMSATVKAALICARESKVLPELLAVTLSVTNYVNGADARLNRADGFHIDALGEGGSLSKVKDARKNDLRQIILKYFIDQNPDGLNKLLEELSPLLQNMKRIVCKKEDGWEARKEIAMSMEDFFTKSNALNAEFDARLRTLKDGQKLVSDRADPLYTYMQVKFDAYKAPVKNLLEEGECISKLFDDLIKWFLMERTRLHCPLPAPGQPEITNQTTTFELFCRIWDDFFIPPNLLTGESEENMKSQIIPRFAKPGTTIRVDDLQYLWHLRPEKSLKPKPKRRPRVGRGSSAPANKGWAAARKSLQEGAVKQLGEIEHTRRAGRKAVPRTLWEGAIAKLKMQRDVVERMSQQQEVSLTSGSSTIVKEQEEELKPSWSCGQSYDLGVSPNLEIVKQSADVLSSEHSSVSTVVGQLNDGIIKSGNGVVALNSLSKGSYWLLWRSDKEQEATLAIEKLKQ